MFLGNFVLKWILCNSSFYYYLLIFCRFMYFPVFNFNIFWRIVFWKFHMKWNFTYFLFLLLNAIIFRAIYFPFQSCFWKKWNKNFPKLKYFSYLEIIWDPLKMRKLRLYYICQSENVGSHTSIVLVTPIIC